jgi:hypothetical protein
VQSFSVLPFSGFHTKSTYLQAKRNSEGRYKNTSRKNAQKTTTQFLKMENPKSSPPTQSPTHHLVGKKQGTLAKETKLTEGCKVAMH